MVEQHQSGGSRFGQLPHVGGRCGGSRRVVGRHDGDHRGPLAEPLPERGQRKLTAPPWDTREGGRPRELGKVIEHLERRFGEEHRATGTEVGPAHAVDRVVRAGGDDHTVGRNSDPGGERRLERRYVWVAAQRVGVEVRQRFEQRRRGQRPLVAVQLQGGGHGTICANRETTTSVPPAAFTAGMTRGRASRGTAALTA